MKFLSGVIAICCALWLHVYVYGLEQSSAAGFNNVFNFYAFCLFSLGIVSIYLSYKEKE
ncbi:hypothetical protein [Carnobacterium sp.]|uniref:hypothetical protein n=1 Tax=Carnobacterium sp. TaxID=48221 RepID=UPI00388DED51